jgi:simple sugar transport system permease protein
VPASRARQGYEAWGPPPPLEMGTGYEMNQVATTPTKPSAWDRFVARSRSLLGKAEAGPLALLIGALITFTLLNATFASMLNVGNLLAFTPELGMIALAMTLLMTAGEFDLSVGSVFGFAPVVMWFIFNEGIAPLEVAFFIALGVAMLIGLVNGLFTTRLKIPSFLVTLGMLLVVRGAALLLTQGFPQRTWKAEGALLAEILVGDFVVPTPWGDLKLYMSLLWFALFALILGYILMASKWGNWIQAAGGNPLAATARGVRVARTKIVLFILTATLAAYSGITSSIRISAANPNSGESYELEIIAMTVIGGTVLQGGKGTIIGTIIGVLLLRVMRNGIVMAGVDALAYKIFIGAIILGMMALHSYMARRQRAEA